MRMSVPQLPWWWCSGLAWFMPRALGTRRAIHIFTTGGTRGCTDTQIMHTLTAIDMPLHLTATPAMINVATVVGTDSGTVASTATQDTVTMDTVAEPSGPASA